MGHARLRAPTLLGLLGGAGHHVNADLTERKGFTQVLYACIGLSIESIDIPILKIDEQVGCVHFTIAAPQAENVFDEVDWTQSPFPQGHGFER